MTPLRQFKGIPRDIVRKAESKQFVCLFPSACSTISLIELSNLAMVSLLRSGKSLCSLYRLASSYRSAQNPAEIGELIGVQNAGKLVHRLVHNFPKLQ